MIRFCSTCLLLLLVHASSGLADIVVAETPVNAMMRSSLFAAGDNEDGFDALDSDRKADGFESLQSTSGGNKSKWKAGLYSALLPGLGEYYVGRKGKAKIFFAVEATSWISFISFHTYSRWKEDDMMKFAAERAGADLEGKDDTFRDLVGFYDDIDQYNTRGRVDDPERPYYQDNSEYHWAWADPTDRATYRSLKNRSREASRRRDFMIGLAVVNRIVSIIDAVRDAGRSLRKIDGSFSQATGIQYRVDINPLDNDRPIAVTLYRKF